MIRNQPMSTRPILALGGIRMARAPSSRSERYCLFQSRSLGMAPTVPRIQTSELPRVRCQTAGPGLALTSTASIWAQSAVGCACAGLHSKVRTAAFHRPRMRMLLAARVIVGRLAGDGDVVHMAFAQARAGDAHELRLFMEFLDRAR